MMRALPTLLLASLPLIAACGGTPGLTGTVVDIWGDPVQGAMVKMAGYADRPVTDVNGRFSLPLADGTHHVQAGREGYIQDEVDVTVQGGSPESELVLELFPIPDENGFHVVGSDGYIRLDPKAVHGIGNNLKSLYGIKETSGASVDGDTLQFVYHGPLTQQQLSQLEISLHKLDFVKTAELQGVTSLEVPLNLYVSAGEVPLKIERLKSRNDYLLTTTEPLEHQVAYALTTNNLLTPADDDAFRQVAPALRLAFPIELR